jgi:hypothetical protein
MHRRLRLALLVASLSACSGGSGNPPVTPAISSAFDPTSGSTASTLNIGATQLQVQGGQFAADDVVAWNGKPQSTTFKGSGELDAKLDPGLTDADGSAQVSVVTGGGVRSNSVTVTVSQLAVTVSSLSPASADPGSGPTTLAVNGTGFVTGAQISFNGAPLVTTRVSGNQLMAQLTAALLAQPGTAAIRVDVPCCAASSQAFSKTLTFPIGPFTLVKTPVFTNGLAPSNLAWDATRGRLYAEQGASILSIDPATGVVSPGMTSGTDVLDGIEISDQDQFVFALDGNQTVSPGGITAPPATRYTLPGFSDPAQVGVVGAFSVAPAPGLPATVAARLDDGTVAVVDGATPRTNVLQPPPNPSFPFPPLTMWGFDSSTLYVQTPQQGSRGFDLLQVFTVDANGIGSQPTVLSSTVSGNLVYDRALRRIFGNDGSNLDEQGNSHGTFALPTDQLGRSLGCHVAPDGANGKVFFACIDDVGITLRSFDADTSAPLSVVVLFPAPVPAGFGPASNLVRWGPSGLAVAVAGQIVFYSGPFVH